MPLIPGAIFFLVILYNFLLVMQLNKSPRIPLTAGNHCSANRATTSLATFQRPALLNYLPKSK